MRCIMQSTTERFFEGQSRPHIYAYTEPQFEKTPWTGARSGKGIIKVGYTTKDVKERMANPTLFYWTNLRSVMMAHFLWITTFIEF